VRSDFHTDLQRNLVQVVRRCAARQRIGSAERDCDDRADFGDHRRLARLFPELQVSRLSFLCFSYWNLFLLSFLASSYYYYFFFLIFIFIFIHFFFVFQERHLQWAQVQQVSSFISFYKYSSKFPHILNNQFYLFFAYSSTQLDHGIFIKFMLKMKKLKL